MTRYNNEYRITYLEGLVDGMATNTSPSTTNNSTTPLNAGATFTGTWELNSSPDVMVSLKTDQVGILYFDFSNDGGVTYDTFPIDGFTVFAGVHEVHNAVKSYRSFRIRMVNTSASNQTYLRAYTTFGKLRQLNAPANSTIASDADTTVVRPLDFNLLVAEGLYQNRQNFIKDGLNEDIDTASVPEDLWSSGGVYTGFPVGVIENGMVVSTSASDTGTIYFAYLASETSTEYVFASATLNGTTPVSLGVNIWRCNFAYYDSGNDTTFNLGVISIYHQTTTTNIFLTIPIGYSQSFCAAYTVPYGNSIYLDRVNGNLRGSATASLDGAFYYRVYGESPKYRFPFELQFGTLYFDDVDYLIRIPERTDIMPRILTSSANNISAKFGYRFVIVKA